jgi:plasmid stabilization system protein ParE
MAKRVSWKNKASLQLLDALIYLKNEFSDTIAENFLEKIEAKTKQLSQYPEIGHATPYKTIRRIKIGKRHSLYYRLDGNRVIVIYLWDHFQHPDKNPYKKKR